MLVTSSNVLSLEWGRFHLLALVSLQQVSESNAVIFFGTCSKIHPFISQVTFSPVCQIVFVQPISPVGIGGSYSVANKGHMWVTVSPGRNVII